MSRPSRLAVLPSRLRPGAGLIMAISLLGCNAPEPGSAGSPGTDGVHQAPATPSSANTATPPPASPPANASGTVEEPAAVALSPLLVPGRVLHFRGRSQRDATRPSQRPAAAVGYRLSNLRVDTAPTAGVWLLTEQSYVSTADGRTSWNLSSARHRRTLELALDPATFEIAARQQMTEVRDSEGQFGKPAVIHLTSDGFGLNAASRKEALLHSFTIPLAMFRDLAAGRAIRRSFDFYLLVDDPRRDRIVRAAGPGPPPPEAETRLRGETALLPEGREPLFVDLRRARAGAPAPGDDQRIRLPVLAVRVEMDLEVTPLRPGSQRWSMRSRRDRLTWLVLDDPAEPWILATEGTIGTREGSSDDPVLREAYLSRELVRVDVGLLDDRQTPP